MKSEFASKTSLGPSKVWLGLVRLLSVVALGLSAFLLWGSLSGDRLPGCGLESGCGTVLHTRWAYFFGMPVSLPALLLYIVVLGTTAVLGRSSTASIQQRVWCILIGAAVALISAAAWFIGLQLFAIGAICPFCMTAHSCGLVVGMMLLAKVPGNSSAPRDRKAAGNPMALPAHLAAKSALSGLLAVVVLGLGQLAYQPKTFDVVPMVAARLDTQRSSNAASALLAASPRTNLVSTGQMQMRTEAPSTSTQTVAATVPNVRPTARTLQVHGGSFSLDLTDLPLHGSAEAPCVIVHLFDYSCRHCRQMHPILLEAMRDLSNQLAIVSLPVPLATNCNRLIKRPIPDHTNACAYARTGLAVWRANREKLPAFEDWLFTPLRPPLPAEVDAEAMRLVGTNEFKKALADPWIKTQLDLSIRLYETNYVCYRRSALPELIIGTNIVAGPLRSAKDLYRLLSAQFDVRLPTPSIPAK
jgi:uncharacterized membrane protein/protein-disulfide isomerase